MDSVGAEAFYDRSIRDIGAEAFYDRSIRDYQQSSGFRQGASGDFSTAADTSGTVSVSVRHSCVADDHTYRFASDG